MLNDEARYAVAIDELIRDVSQDEVPYVLAGEQIPVLYFVIGGAALLVVVLVVVIVAVRSSKAKTGEAKAASVSAAPPTPPPGPWPETIPTLPPIRCRSRHLRRRMPGLLSWQDQPSPWQEELSGGQGTDHRKGRFPV